jgi:hypothetical protein
MLLEDIVMNHNALTQVIFPEGFDERARIEMSSKGWISAVVLLEDGLKYHVYFSDIVRLKQDMDENIRSGKPFFAEPGLVVIPEVSVEVIYQVVNLLVKDGFFASMQPSKG